MRLLLTAVLSSFLFLSQMVALRAGETLATEPAGQKPALEMHRTQSGTDDGSGWYQANSTGGGFMVSLPAKFNDFTINSNEPGIGAVATDVLVAERSNGIKVQVTRVHGPEKSAPASLDALLAGLKSNAPEGQTIETVERGSESGLPSLTATAHGPDNLAFLRYLVDGTNLYFISVECLATVKSECETVRGKVFSTFSRG